MAELDQVPQIIMGVSFIYSPMVCNFSSGTRTGRKSHQYTIIFFQLPQFFPQKKIGFAVERGEFIKDIFLDIGRYGGVYLYELRVEDRVKTRKLALLR